MNRRDFIKVAPVASATALVGVAPGLAAFQGSGEKSGLKIASVRLVQTKPRRPVPSYQPAPGSWSTGGVEVANPMSIYAEYKARRSLF